MIDNGVYCLSFLNKKSCFWTFTVKKRDFFFFKTHFVNEGRDLKSLHFTMPISNIHSVFIGLEI